MLVWDFILLALSFLAIWFSAGIAIEAVESFATRFNLSKFTMSLFVLGTVTSLPEIAITLNAIVLQSPQIAVGNLIGGQVFILFLIVPLLAILSKGLHLKVQMQSTSLILTLLVVIAPILAFLDQTMQLSEALVILGLYIVFIANFAKSSSLVDRVIARLKRPEPKRLWWEIAKLIGAVAVLLLASNFAVKGIIELSASLEVPGFLVSLIILPIGTNLPELTLAIKAVMYGKRDVALGDFIGSMTFNSFLLFILAVAYGGGIIIGQNIALLVAYLIVGIFIFWFFCRSQKYLSVREGTILLLIFFGFITIAAFLGLDGFFQSA